MAHVRVLVLVRLPPEQRGCYMRTTASADVFTKKSLPFLEWRCPLQSSRLIDFSLVLIRGRLRDRSIWLLFNNYTFSNNCSLLPVPFARLLALVAFLALPQRFRALLESPAVWA